LSGWTDRGGGRASRTLATLTCVALAAAPARAQDTTVVTPPVAPPPTVRRASVFELLNLDKLQLATLGGSMGRVRPTNVVPTELYSLQADYGEIARDVRIVFVVTYWGSRYTRRAIGIFEDALGEVVRDPAGDDTVRVA